MLFRSKPAVFTFSVHCRANYFSEKEVKNSFSRGSFDTRHAEFTRLAAALLFFPVASLFFPFFFPRFRVGLCMPTHHARPRICHVGMQKETSTPTPTSAPIPISALDTHRNKQSDVDVEVDEGAGDEEYLGLLEERLPTLVDQVRPDLIFYQVRTNRMNYSGKFRNVRSIDGTRRPSRTRKTRPLANSFFFFFCCCFRHCCSPEKEQTG